MSLGSLWRNLFNGVWLYSGVAMWLFCENVTAEAENG
jgi:hypothetical protein